MYPKPSFNHTETCTYKEGLYRLCEEKKFWAEKASLAIRYCLWIDIRPRLNFFVPALEKERANHEARNSFCIHQADSKMACFHSLWEKGTVCQLLERMRSFIICYSIIRISHRSGAEHFVSNIGLVCEGFYYGKEILRKLFIFVVCSVGSGGSLQHELTFEKISENDGISVQHGTLSP